MAVPPGVRVADALAAADYLRSLPSIRADRIGVIGFSAGRPHALVLRAFKLARKRHCGTVAITDASLSELTRLADHCLYYSSNSPSYTRSHTALLALIQGLAYSVYTGDQDAYQERIRAFRLK